MRKNAKLSFVGKTDVRPDVRKASVREHGPYYEGGPRLLTYEFEEPMLVRGKLVRRYTIPIYA